MCVVARNYRGGRASASSVGTTNLLRTRIARSVDRDGRGLQVTRTTRPTCLWSAIVKSSLKEEGGIRVVPFCAPMNASAAEKPIEGHNGERKLIDAPRRLISIPLVENRPPENAMLIGI